MTSRGTYNYSDLLFLCHRYDSTSHAQLAKTIKDPTINHRARKVGTLKNPFRNKQTHFFLGSRTHAHDDTAHLSLIFKHKCLSLCVRLMNTFAWLFHFLHSNLTWLFQSSSNWPSYHVVNVTNPDIWYWRCSPYNVMTNVYNKISMTVLAYAGQILQSLRGSSTDDILRCGTKRCRIDDNTTILCHVFGRRLCLIHIQHNCCHFIWRCRSSESMKRHQLGRVTRDTVGRRHS